MLLRLLDIGDIRLPLFLLSVSTEVAVAFLPVHARALARPDWLSADLAAAPLVCYLLAVALLTRFGGRLARRGEVPSAEHLRANSRGPAV